MLSWLVYLSMQLFGRDFKSETISSEVNVRNDLEYKLEQFVQNLKFTPSWKFKPFSWQLFLEPFRGE